MTARKYCEQAKIIRRKMRRIEAKCDQLRLTAEGAVAVFSPTKTKGGIIKNQIEEAVIDIDMLEKHYADLYTEYKIKYTKIEKTIENVPNEKCKELLTYRYLCDWTWESIAEEMKMSYQYVCGNLHKKALSYIKI